MSAPAPPAIHASIVASIDAYLARVVAQLDAPANLAQAMSYALLQGGKRLRPALVLLSCEAVGGRQEQALPAAAAIEMIHAFSLVHDDLPAMDDDDLRRGQPTCHIKFGEAMAILAGDALATLPYLHIARSVADAEVRCRLIDELSAATMAMIAGQTLDTLGGFPEDLTSIQRLESVHHAKTGALIRGACRLGAISGGATADQLHALSTYGESIGLLFQVVDDILDVTQSAEHLGKRANKDEAAGKLTYPSILGLEESQQLAERLCRQGIESVQPFGDAGQTLIELCQYMGVRTK
ncbi:MAG: polyprenyl synthetase family protein [Phycisphaerales bacterium]|nr:polyprenyl synthetase family protein [Phycisphaerales bacterium]